MAPSCQESSSQVCSSITSPFSLWFRLALILVLGLPGGVVTLYVCGALRNIRYLEDVAESSLAVALSIPVLRKIEAVSNKLELLPLRMLRLVSS